MFWKKRTSGLIRLIISSSLSWDSHVMHIVLKTNRMVGLLKRTCPLITDVEVRRTLYLSLVKSQLSYATDCKSVKLTTILERVQRCATRWILRTKIGEVSYKQRLLTLRLLPLTYDREIGDLVFLFKVTRPSFFGGVPSYFEALWYPHLYFYRKSNT